MNINNIRDSIFNAYDEITEVNFSNNTFKDCIHDTENVLNDILYVQTHVKNIHLDDLAIFYHYFSMNKIKEKCYKNENIFYQFRIFDHLVNDYVVYNFEVILTGVRDIVYFTWKKIGKETPVVIEDQLRSYYEMEYQSNHDSLTNLCNRRSFTNRWKNYVGVVENTGVIYFDLNELKTVNDTYGHDAGDELIINFSKLLLSTFRKDDCFRVGGDEFVVVMSNMSITIFNERIELLFKNINNFNSQNNKIKISVSYGYDWKSHICGINDMLRNSEKRMYNQKRLYYKNNNYKR